MIRRYLKAARKAKALLILDIQPGRSDFFTEAKRLRKWLREPDVGLALDPEWRMGPGEVPGQVIGCVDAARGQRHAAWLDQLVQRDNLPQKLLLIHQFTDDMIPRVPSSRSARAGATCSTSTASAPGRKVAKYKEFAEQATGLPARLQALLQGGHGDDVAAEVMRLTPRPDVVVYE